jgi:3-methyladenine DNA glycosylase AlkD
MVLVSVGAVIIAWRAGAARRAAAAYDAVMKTVVAARAAAAVRRLEAESSAAHREGIVRYGIAAPKILGVPMEKIQALGKELGRDQELASALWDTGVYEARLLAAYVGDPARLSVREAERWIGDFDNWAVCDTHCFVLFDRTPFAYEAAIRWCGRKPEFERRAGFGLIASLAGHDRLAADEAFFPFLAECEKAADDGRNFVKKGVSWALRRMGGRSLPLLDACTALATKLAASENAVRRWVGKDVLRDIGRPVVRARAEKGSHRADELRRKAEAKAAAKAARGPKRAPSAKAEAAPPKPEKRPKRATAAPKAREAKSRASGVARRRK